MNEQERHEQAAVLKMRIRLARGAMSEAEVYLKKGDLELAQDRMTWAGLTLDETLGK